MRATQVTQSRLRKKNLQSELTTDISKFQLGDLHWRVVTPEVKSPPHRPQTFADEYIRAYLLPIFSRLRGGSLKPEA
jgi:hypothetical protein